MHASRIMRLGSTVAAICVLGSLGGCALRLNQTSVKEANKPEAPPAVNPFEGFAAKARALANAHPEEAQRLTVETLHAMADALAALPDQPLTPGMAADRVRLDANQLQQIAKPAPKEAAPVRDAAILGAEALAVYVGEHGPPDPHDILDARNAARAIDPDKKISDQTNVLAQAFSVLSDAIAEKAESARTAPPKRMTTGSASDATNAPASTTSTAALAIRDERPLDDLLHALATEDDAGARSALHVALHAIAGDLGTIRCRSPALRRSIASLDRAFEAIARSDKPLELPMRVREGVGVAGEALAECATTPTEKMLAEHALRSAKAIRADTPFELQRAAVQDALRTTVDALLVLRKG